MLKRPEELHQDVAERGDRGDEAAGTENCLCSRCAAGFGQLIAKLLKVWSRGRELNSRPADYEMSCFAVSRWFLLSAILSLSLPFAPILRANLQRILQR